MRYGAGKYVNQVTHFIPGHSELFPRMESGDIDATLTELRRFDDYRDKHPDTNSRLPVTSTRSASTWAMSALLPTGR